MPASKPDKPLTELILYFGQGEYQHGRAKIADALGLCRSAVYQWWRLPSHHVLKIEQITAGEFPVKRTRPDLL